MTAEWVLTILSLSGMAVAYVVGRLDGSLYGWFKRVYKSEKGNPWILMTRELTEEEYKLYEAKKEGSVIEIDGVEYIVYEFENEEKWRIANKSLCKSPIEETPTHYLNKK